MFLVVLAGFGTLALGQDWPKAAPTPRTEVLCNTSGCVDSSEGKKLVGYSSPISSYVGRYLDTTSIGVDFNVVHTMRAKEMRIAPDRNRIYTMLGSIFAAYDINSFFSRLESGEVMASIRDVGSMKDRPNRRDAFLYWDRYFYMKNGTSQNTYPDLNAGDGEDKFFDYDWDDRGYIYMANGPYSWGITRDDYGTGRTDDRLKTVYQRTGRKVNEHPYDVPDPNRIVSVKVGNQYYVLVLDFQGGTAVTSIVNVWNVTTPTAPTHVKSALFGNSSSGGFNRHVRSADGTRFAVLNKVKGLDIYTGESLINIGAPLASFTDDDYLALTTDGTTFYATSIHQSSGVVTIHIISPSGSTYTKKSHVVGIKSPAGYGALNYGAGYLALCTRERERGLNGAFNVWLLKLNGTNKPTEMALGAWVNGSESTDYISKFYSQSAAPSGYVSPGNWSDLKGAHVHKKGAKYYLLIEAFGIADVYEIKGADSIDARVKKVGKKSNENSKAPANSGPYYGDELTFTTDFSGTAAAVEWNFGDNVIESATANSPDISHQYGGLLASDLPKTRNVTATNFSDPAQKDTISVTLAKPQVRVGLSGTTTLFTQSATDYTLPIVSSDFFTDASDGAVEGHYSEWNIDTLAAAKREPDQKQSVGPIGKRTLTFTGHYGPYSVSGSTITPGTADAAFSINSIKYEVRPFAAGIIGPLSCTGTTCNNTAGGTSVGFRNATRVTTTALDLTGLAGALVNYKWELLKPGTGGMVDAGHSLPGQSAISGVPDFIVPRSAFQNAVDWKARLTLTLVTPAAVGDAQYAVATVDSVPLLGPTTNSVARNGCENVGSPCSFNTPSTRQDIDPATWTYLWEVIDKPVASAAIPNGVSATFSPKFLAAGSYTVRVKVSNAIGDATLTTLPFSVGLPICASAPTDATSTISWRGATSGCAANSNCSINENIAFIVQPFQWIPGDCDKYEWDFGDGSAKSTEKEPVHAYNRAGSFVVTVKIDGGLSDATTQRTVVVGNTTPDPDPDPDPIPTGCSTMSANGNVGIGLAGNTTNCTAGNPACSTADTITFTVSSFNYNFSCGSHTFTWNFADGSSSKSGRTVEHKFANAGTYPVSVKIKNSKQELTVPVANAVRVSGGGTDPTTCPSMIANGNVFIALTGPVSGCNAVTGNCRPAENIGFRAATLSYSYDCAPHTFAWTFGDGSSSTEQNPVHAYTTGGTFKVTLKVTRSGQSVNMEQNLTVTQPAPNCPKMEADFNVFTTFIGPKSHCTSSGGSCEEDEEILFNVNGYQYNFSCSTHSFLWDFGDGSPGVGGQSPAHTYTRPGTFPIKVKVNNGLEEVILSDSITILPDGPTRRRGVRK